MLQLEREWYFLPPFVGIHTEMLLGSDGSSFPHIVHFPLTKLWGADEPVVSPQEEQVFGVVQLASIQECSKALPSVMPHSVHFLADVHVASSQLWVWIVSLEAGWLPVILGVFSVLG